MPVGVMPTFYDFSRVSAFPYAAGGYCLDNILTSGPKVKVETAAGTATPPSPAQVQLKRLKQQVPLPVRAFVRRHVDRLSSSLQN